MKIKFLIIIFLTIHTFASAQSAAEAERMFNSKQYAKAKTLYETLLKSKPADPLLSYRLARCNYELNDWDNAIKNFEISGTKFPLTQWYLAESLFNHYRFDDATIAFDNFLNSLSPEDLRIPKIQLQKKRAETAARLLKRIEDIAIIDSVITDKTAFLKKYDLAPELGVLRQSIIKQGKDLAVDKITYTTQRGDRQIFSDTLAGNIDIFSTYRLLDQWSAPVAVSKAVNTADNENYPFLLPDGLTLYYASDGENSIGGYDIFVTRYSSISQGFLNPENVGFPFNSPWNDYMMAIDELQGIGWFATDRRQPKGKIVIYKFRYNNDKIIYRTENKDTLRLAGSLQMYRKTKKNQNTSNQQTITEVSTEKNEFSFLVTDSLIYSSYNDFQNPAALISWKEYQKMNSNYNQSVNYLNQLRKEFEKPQSDKNKLAQTILQKESELLIMQNEIKVRQVNIRNEEIIFIRQKKQK